MSRCIIAFTLLLAFARPGTATAQTKSYTIAVLAPLYLDSSFDAAGAYKLGKQFPRYAFSGLEFAEGARLALDTLQTQGAQLQCSFYDIRSADQTIPRLIESHRLDSIQLIIASINGGDYQTLAAFARMRGIPFVSATWPNEGGVSANPFVCILNPTILSHCEAIYHFIRVNHPTHQILYVRKPGPMEDRLEGYFKQLNERSGAALLPIQTITAGDTVTAATLQPYLDSDRYAVIVCGSLDDPFGTSLVRTCATLSTSYPMTLIGMPTWESNRALEGADLRQMPYLYTDPFLNPDIDSSASAQSLVQRFTNLAHARPGEMAFRGYESVYLFANLLLKYGNTLMSHAGDASFQTYTPFDIKPVFAQSGAALPDYFENKHIYILRRQNGAVTRLQ
jgi:hypothetical protein